MMKSSLTYAYRRNARMFKWLWWLPFFMVFMGEAVKQTNDFFNPFTSFRAYSISVPNHCEGEDPPIHVLRRSTGTARGSWASWYEDALKARAPICPFESVSRIYKPKDDFLVSMSLYQYMGQSEANGVKCFLPPGTYYPFIMWTFTRPWHNDVDVTLTSNQPFEVWPRSDPRCQEEANQ